MGFLSSMLPTIAGAGLMAASGGAINPLTAGLILGGLQTARTGSVEKGLMAGIGAYGGAGLAGGLMGAGASQAGAVSNALGANGATGAGSQAAMLAEQNAAGGFGQAGLESLGQSAAVAPGATPVVQPAGQSMLAGANSLGSQAGRTAFAQQMGGNAGMMKAGLAAAAPMMSAVMPSPVPVQQDTKMPQRLQYNPGMAMNAQGQPMMPPSTVPGPDDLGRDFGAERNYFPYAGYQQISQEQAKAMRGYANGGPVEAMSTNNSVGANTGYPGADIGGHDYSTPWQTPVSQNVVSGAQDVAVDPYTGAEQRTAPAPVAQFADGGVTGQGGLDLHIPIDLGGGSGGSGGFGGSGANGYSAAGSGGGTPNGEGLGFGGGNMGFGGYGQQMGFGGAQDQFGGFASFLMEKMINRMNGRPDNYVPQQEQGTAGGQAALAQGQNNVETQSQTALNTAAAGNTATAEPQAMAGGGMAQGGISALGGYSDGGRLLKGPGDGVSDSIPATIGNKRPARLADGEFVVPARIVSELGNGSTEAGARKLYAMLDRVQKARGKTVGKGKVAKNSRADKFLPA